MKTASNALALSSSSTALFAESQRRAAFGGAARALDCASGGTDIDALHFAIAEATRAGVSEPLVAKARKRKRLLEDNAAKAISNQEKCDASDALEAAVGSNSLDMLISAIATATEFGVDRRKVEFARRRQTELEASQREQLAVSNAMKLLRETTPGPDWQGSLLSCIRNVINVGVSPQLLNKLAVDGGSQNLLSNAVSQILEEALTVENPATLERVIAWARETGVSTDAISNTITSARMEEAREGAANALAKTLQDNSLEALDVAISNAERTGVSKVMLTMARKRRTVLHKDHLLAEAQDRIQLAKVESDITALGSAIEGAISAGLDSVTIDEAREFKRVLEFAELRRQICAEAVDILNVAMLKGECELLEAAIEQAQDVGISSELVARAKRKLARCAQQTEEVEPQAEDADDTEAESEAEAQDDAEARVESVTEAQELVDAAEVHGETAAEALMALVANAAEAQVETAAAVNGD